MGGHMERLLLGVMAIAILVTGCSLQDFAIVDPSASCDEIIRSSLLTIPFEELAQDREKTEQWISTEYPTAMIEFQPVGGQRGIGFFLWSEGEKGFELALAQPYRYMSQNARRYPTLGHILGCYGDPKYYSLGDIRGGPEARSAVRLDLWYPDRGLYFNSVSDGVLTLSTVRHYDRNSPIVGIIKVMPEGTVEEMMQKGGINIESYLDLEQARLREWPGNFTELVLEE